MDEKSNNDSDSQESDSADPGATCQVILMQCVSDHGKRRTE